MANSLLIGLTSRLSGVKDDQGSSFLSVTSGFFRLITASWLEGCIVLSWCEDDTLSSEESDRPDETDRRCCLGQDQGADSPPWALVVVIALADWAVGQHGLPRCAVHPSDDAGRGDPGAGRDRRCWRWCALRCAPVFDVPSSRAEVRAAVRFRVPGLFRFRIVRHRAGAEPRTGGGDIWPRSSASRNCGARPSNN